MMDTSLTVVDRILESGQLLFEEIIKTEIRACNEQTLEFGLSLSEADIAELMECRREALAKAGRIEFGEGILPKLIYAFCDSPYIEADEYKDILEQLQENFYYFKSESGDRYTDDELISFMVSVFHTIAHGSVEFLAGTSLPVLVRCGRAAAEEFDLRKRGAYEEAD